MQHHFVSPLIKKAELLPKDKATFLYSIIALIGITVLNLGIFKDYALTDAYEFLWSAHSNSNFKDIFIQGGRPLYGELSKIIFGTLSHTVSDLKWVRLFSTLCCVLLSIQIFSFLQKMKMKKSEATIFSFLILTTPSFSVYMGWSAVFQIPIALNFSFLAGVFLLKIIEKKRFRLLNYIVALLLVIVSLCLYQSAGTAFLIPLVFSLINNNNRILKTLIHLFVFFGVSFGLYYAIFKVSLNLYGVNALSRSSIDFIGLPYKMIKFYSIEMNRLQYGSSLLIRPKAFFYSGSILFVGFFLSIIKQKDKNFNLILLLLFLLIVLPISYLPNLLSTDKCICSRTIAPAAIILLFFQFYFLKRLSTKNKFIRLISLTLAIGIIIVSSFNVNVYIANIQAKEYFAVKTAFNSISKNNTRDIILVRPETDYLQKLGYCKYFYSDEYGQSSCSRDWVPIPFFKQVIKEKTKSPPIFNYKIKTCPSNEFYPNTDSIIVINIKEILKKEFL